MKGLIINVGRQFGSGGKLVALEIGRQLGINVYDNELISKAAEASGFSRDLFMKNDEKRSIFSFSSFFSPQGFGQMGNCIDESALFKIQSNVIKDIAEHESAVIVGRCADYILRDRGMTLDIFISAPLEDRIKRVSERMGLPLVNVHATVADYQREGQTTKYHRASLIERFNVMRRHYGLPVTLACHAWFAVRLLVRR